jgi:hypothetical protein
LEFNILLVFPDKKIILDMRRLVPKRGEYFERKKNKQRRLIKRK